MNKNIHFVLLVIQGCFKTFSIEILFYGSLFNNPYNKLIANLFNPMLLKFKVSSEFFIFKNI